MRSIALKVGIFLTACAMPCGASEIHVLSAAVMQTVFKEAVGEFEPSSGHKVVFVYATMGAITERLLGGETADLIIGSTGTPVPAFATPDDVRQALLAAKTVVYAKPVSPTK